MVILPSVIIELEGGLSLPEDIWNNLKVLYSTRIGEQDHDRDFGIDWSILDLPMNLAKLRLEQELIVKTRKYEPRVDVSRVVWTYGPEEGQMQPKVVLTIV